MHHKIGHGLFGSVIGLLVLMFSSHFTMASGVFGAGIAVTNLNPDIKTAGIGYFEKEGRSDLSRPELSTLGYDLRREDCFTSKHGEDKEEAEKGPDRVFEGVNLFHFHGFEFPAPERIIGRQAPRRILEKEGVSLGIRHPQDDVSIAPFFYFGTLPKVAYPVNESLFFHNAQGLEYNQDGERKVLKSHTAVLPQSEKTRDRETADLVKHQANGIQNTVSDRIGPPDNSLFGMIARIRTTLTEAWQERRSPGQLMTQPFPIQSSIMGQSRSFSTPITDSLALHLNFETDTELDQNNHHSVCAGVTLNF